MSRDAHSAAKAVDMLDLLIEFFDDGERWIKGKLDDGAAARSPGRGFVGHGNRSGTGERGCQKTHNCAFCKISDRRC